MASAGETSALESQRPISIDGRQRFDWLQALRGVAALAVVITHARLEFRNTPLWETADRWLRSGESGVDLFFVISGFIMVYTTRNDPGGAASAVSFSIKRLARIWPAYAFVTILAAMLYYGLQLLSNPVSQSALLKSLLFIPVSYDNFYARQVLPQGWSLNYEMYFYFAFALSLLASRLRWVIFCALFFLTLIVVPALSNAPSLVDPFLAFAGRNYAFDYMAVIANPMIWEFLGGALAGLAFDSKFRFGSAILGWVAIAIAALVCLAVLTHPTFSHGPFQWGSCFILLVFAVSIASKDVKLNIHPILVGLGNMSYTLYLVHLLVMDLATQLLTLNGFDRLDHPFVYVAIVVALSLVAAALSYRFLEQTLSQDFKVLLLKLPQLLGRRRSLRAAPAYPPDA
jgi:exopolysaccharide production protein ExoZ